MRTCILAADRDEDGIDDAVETQLLQQFAPVLKRDLTHNAPEGGVGVPVSVTWLLRNSDIYRKRPTPGYELLVSRPSVAQAIQVVSNVSIPEGVLIRNQYVWGNAPGDGASWPIAAERGDGVYGRVWKPFVGYPYLYSIQYFILLTWNETAYSGDFGDHEADWLCLDFTVDVRCGIQRPPVIHSVYHNHGRQLFLTPEAIEFEDGHPVAYLERGTNEPWPNSGDRGFGGWPASNGFASNGNFDFDDVAAWYEELLADFIGGINEHKIVREHSGVGNRYATHRIPNVGEMKEGGPLSLCGDEGTFILLFAGKWGWEAADGGDCPRGPWQQPKLTRRDWNRGGAPSGPWGAGRGLFVDGGAIVATTYSSQGGTPIRNCTGCPSGFHLYTSPNHTFIVPQLRDVTYVDFSATPPGLGTESWPYRDILLGLAMTRPGGTIITRGGNTPQRFTINQSVTITSDRGITTIGK